MKKSSNEHRFQLYFIDRYSAVFVFLFKFIKKWEKLRTDCSNWSGGIDGNCHYKIIQDLCKQYKNTIIVCGVFLWFFLNTFSCLLRLYFFNCLSRKLIYINSIDQCVIFVMHMYYELLMVHVWQETFLSDFSNGKTSCSYHSYQANVVP